MPDPPSLTDPSSSSADPNTKIHLIAQYEKTVFRGPIPDPEMLLRYETVQRGFADRILKMAETEGEHRRTQESKALTANIKAVEREQEEVKRGQNYGLTVALFAISIGLIAALNGAEWFGIFIGAGGVVGLASVFVYKQRQSEKQPQKQNTHESLDSTT